MRRGSVTSMTVGTAGDIRVDKDGPFGEILIRRW
jgi:hypothetical protein